MSKTRMIYPYIGHIPEIGHGGPLIKGTRITVRTIAGYYQLGMSVDEIMGALRHLTPAQVHSALAYYFDHQDEIDRDLADVTDEEKWKSLLVTAPPGDIDEAKAAVR